MNRTRIILLLLSTTIFLIPIIISLQTFDMDLNKLIFSEGNFQSSKFFNQTLNISQLETKVVDFNLDLTGIMLSIEMNMSNPYDFPITINSIHFLIHCSNHSDIKMGIGENSQTIMLEPHSLSQVLIKFSVTPEGLSHIYSNHLHLPSFIIELTLNIENIEIETSIYGVTMTISIKDSLKLPIHYEFLKGI